MAASSSIKCPLYAKNRARILLTLAVVVLVCLLLNTKLLNSVQFQIKSDLLEDFQNLSMCRPHKSIVFLKTHKCASSTVQNIFLRFGDRHNLTFALPPSGNYLGHPKPFNHTMVPDAKKFNLTYRIFTHHTRFDYNEIRRIMPEDSMFFTIVRDPVDMFESLYSYYHMHTFYGKSLNELGINTTRASQELLNKRSHSKLGLNQMSFDLGLDIKFFKNETAIRLYAEMLDNVFDLVLVAERMEESLILLKHLLCWETDDVVVFKHNARSKVYKSNLSAESRERIRRLNSADVVLYKYFQERLQQRIEQFGVDKMVPEIDELRNRTRTWYETCVKTEDLLNKVVPEKYRVNSQVLAFKPKDNASKECHRFLAQELVFTDELRTKQKVMYPPTPPPPRRRVSRIRRPMKRPMQRRSRHFVGDFASGDVRNIL